ncbi:MAG: hypothetical protein K2P93_05030 [Alphaproteobacteria bacterium]|nr:hypothetical protein [Alphaproteobacteria bacterium]
MTQSPRLISLLIIPSYGMLIAYLMGIEDKIPWKKTLGCPLYSVFKQGLINFQRCVAQSLADNIETIFHLFERAKNVFF